MIFVTVGMQLGFDRLISAMDRLAPSLGEKVVAQIGDGKFAPVNMCWQRKFSPAEIDEMFETASLIIAHAGIGTVLAAQRYAKPVVLLPRKSALGEHRNDHQLATVKYLAGRPGISIAFEASDLGRAIEEALSTGNLPPGASSGTENLKQAVANFIENGILIP